MEPIDAGRNRSMRGENIPGRGCLAGLSEGELVLLHEQPNALQGQKGGMPLVHVADSGPQAHGFQRADATDAQQDLLLDSQLVVTAIELVRDIPILRPVGIDIGIQQVKGHTANLRPPNLSLDHTARILDLYKQR